MNDLFSSSPKTTKASTDYTAKDIEVLEGLEPVRRRPGMYIGGTDERALHHLVAELLDNSMDEAVAGHADRIEIELLADGSVRIEDNGRGIPIDRHAKFKDKSALEVIMTTLHSGGKFSDKAYATAGGLHGVGLSVVNALSQQLRIEVARERELWVQEYAKGHPTSKLKKAGAAPNRRGTAIIFHPDTEIFGKGAHFKPGRLYRMARAKAYLFRGVEIRWRSDPKLILDDTPAEAVLHFPGGLEDFLRAELAEHATITPNPFAGRAPIADGKGRVEWAVAWPTEGEAHSSFYCNTVPTPDGGTHEQGLRNGLLRALKGYGDLTGNRRAAQITADDLMSGSMALLSIFIPEPQFQGQTKEKLASPEALRWVENAIKDHFDHWLSGAPEHANSLLGFVIDRAEDRLRRKQEKEVNRKSATRRLRLPGKLADCTRDAADGTEIFLVEGDSAGGSAKQARNRSTQAVLPLRGKILNVASAGAGKLVANQELSDLAQALGCGLGARCNEKELRYDKVIIMTDADVDGAHIASLLITFFYREMRPIVVGGHLYLAQPPLYRLGQGGKVLYARDDAHKEELLKKEFSGRGKVDISRFKGLGEMPPVQLRETTMDPKKRNLLRVELSAEQEAFAETRVEQLMGRRPELRFAFIQEHANLVTDVDV